MSWTNASHAAGSGREETTAAPTRPGAVCGAVHAAAGDRGEL
ncbi:MAG: hypothetical protein Q4E05_09845 [Pseudoclavibacter sp.]|nr:hypothetical protein [Pseudoclavibacter sp.]